jgi:DNA-binding transcriptional LysR family regulator
MEIADLKTLISVVEHGSVTQAAKKLNRVPSGITTRILQLEESLGVQLFLREKKRLLVTPQGQELCDYAKRIMNLLDEAETRVKGAEPGGLFRIGAMESTLAARLAEPLAKLHNQYTGLRLELTSGTSHYLYEQLLDNNLDAVFIADPSADDRIECTQIFEEELVIIAPCNHRSILEPTDIARDTILAFKEGCSYRNRFINWFRIYNMKPDRIAELTSYHAILGGVAAGMGIGVVPYSVVELYPQKNTFSIHSFNHGLAKIETVVAWRKGMKTANIIEMIRCVHEVMVRSSEVLISS